MKYKYKVVMTDGEVLVHKKDIESTDVNLLQSVLTDKGSIVVEVDNNIHYIMSSDKIKYLIVEEVNEKDVRF